MTFIDADRLQAFVADEIAERRSCQTDHDSDALRSADAAYIEALHVVAAYVERVAARRPTLAEIERGAAA